MNLPCNFTIGILGTGQLARMLVMEGSRLGYSFCLFDPLYSNMKGCAEDLCTKYLSIEEFASKSNLITIETENIPQGLLTQLSEKMFPSVEIVKTCQDRLLEKEKAKSLEISTTPYQKIDNIKDLRLASQKLPAILKTRSMGYDGKGQYIIEKESDIDNAWKRVGGMPCILEEKISFTSEASVLAFANNSQLNLLGPMDNVHEKGILINSTYPSKLNKSIQTQMREIVASLAKDMKLRGTLCVEFFCLKDDSILLNEMSPRVHNSGHWTLNGASISQFEQHIRAITGLHLPQIKARGNVTMKNMIGKPNFEYLSLENSHFNLYNKENRKGRKIGHVTLIQET